VGGVWGRVIRSLAGVVEPSWFTTRPCFAMILRRFSITALVPTGADVSDDMIGLPSKMGTTDVSVKPLSTTSPASLPEANTASSGDGKTVIDCTASSNSDCAISCLNQSGCRGESARTTRLPFGSVCNRLSSRLFEQYFFFFFGGGVGIYLKKMFCRCLLSVWASVATLLGLLMGSGWTVSLRREI